MYVCTILAWGWPLRRDFSMLTMKWHTVETLLILKQWSGVVCFSALLWFGLMVTLLSMRSQTILLLKYSIWVHLMPSCTYSSCRETTEPSRVRAANCIYRGCRGGTNAQEVFTCSAFSVSSMKICCSFSFTKLMQNCSNPFFWRRLKTQIGLLLYIHSKPPGPSTWASCHASTLYRKPSIWFLQIQ